MMPPSEVRRESERAELVVRVVVGCADWFGSEGGLVVSWVLEIGNKGRGGEADVPFCVWFGLVWI